MLAPVADSGGSQSKREVIMKQVAFKIAAIGGGLVAVLLAGGAGFGRI
jgi:hypothetical protein